MLDQPQAQVLILGLALFFFALVPLIGAFRVRQQWRDFRLAVFASLDLPLFGSESPRIDLNASTPVRFFGVLEAVEANDHVWLRGQQETVRVPLKNEKIYILPPETSRDFVNMGFDPLQCIKWEKTGVLTEGMGAFVVGVPSKSHGFPLIGRQRGQRFLVLFYDGKPEGVLSRVIWHARQKNEFWNDLTPSSLLLGTMALLFCSVFLSSNTTTRSESIWAAAFALIPYLPLIPPGLAGFLVYRGLWQKSRLYRAKKDLYLLAERALNSEQLRLHCSYQSQVLTQFNQDIEDGMRKIELSGRAKATTIKYFPLFRRDPAAESFLIKGADSLSLKHLMRKVSLYEIASLGFLSAGLLINFSLIVFLGVQLVKSF